MVRWVDMAFPKDFGGLGFTETRAMNTALIAKCIFKLKSNDQNVLNWDRVPLNFDDFFILADIRSDFKHRAVKIALLAAICWTLRTTRNNMWSPLHRLEEKSDLEKLVKRLKEGGGEELA
uniref:Uncharacterized protein n=1 Tax=Oryza nivara TaxID=4536 RepID=A0A0E0IA23_ORYNI